MLGWRKKKESWNNCKVEIEKLFREKVDIEEKIITERAKGAKKKKKDSKINQPRPIICPLLNFKDKENIFKNSRNLKRTKKFVYKDFCQETLEHRRELSKEVKYLRERKIRLLIWIIIRLLSEVKTFKIKLASLLVVKWKQADLECKLKIAPNTCFESFSFVSFLTEKKLY